MPGTRVPRRNKVASDKLVTGACRKQLRRQTDGDSRAQTLVQTRSHRPRLIQRKPLKEGRSLAAAGNRDRHRPHRERTAFRRISRHSRYGGSPPRILRACQETASQARPGSRIERCLSQIEFPRKSGSHKTHRWREVGSNARSRRKLRRRAAPIISLRDGPSAVAQSVGANRLGRAARRCRRR